MKREKLLKMAAERGISGEMLKKLKGSGNRSVKEADMELSLDSLEGVSGGTGGSDALFNQLDYDTQWRIEEDMIAAGGECPYCHQRISLPGGIDDGTVFQQCRIFLQKSIAKYLILC